MGQVVVAEFDAANALLANINATIFANAVVFHRAVWSEARTLQLAVADGPKTGGHRTVVAVGHQVVRAETLADIVTRLGADRIDFLRVDCEGAEWEIVQEINRTYSPHPVTTNTAPTAALAAEACG